MKLRVLTALFAVAVIVLANQSAWSCSELFVGQSATDDYRISARTMDLCIPTFPQLVLSPRGIERIALLPSAGDTPVSWTAIYGSVNVYVFNTNICTDGVNEAGLSAALLWSEGSVYPTGQSDRAMSLNYWSQYCLDKYSLVAEAVADVRDMKIYNPLSVLPAALHLVLHDANGDSAVLEYDDSGNLKVYTPTSSPTAYNGVLTNEPFYPLQIANLANYKPWGGALDLPGGSEPESRFVRGSYCLKQMYTPRSDQEAVGNTFQFIQYMATPYMAGSGSEAPWPTTWTTVRDQTELTYYFDTYNKPGVRYTYLKDIDFTAGQSMKAQWLDDSNEGDVGSRFLAIDYNPNGLNSYKALSINPYRIYPFMPFSYSIYLSQDITKAFDFYVVATAGGITLSIDFDGKIEDGIKPILRNVPSAKASILLSVTPAAVFPLEVRGQVVTFYCVAVEVGKTPPIASLEDLMTSTPYVIYMDKEPMTVK